MPDRALHPIRRRTVRSRLEGKALPTDVLFICHGNICRSAYAGRALADRLSPVELEHISVSSAGFVGPGRCPPAEAIEVAWSRGVDLSAHRSRLVTISMIAQADLIVTMEAAQRRALVSVFGAPTDRTIVLGDLDPGWIRRRGITDPYQRPRQVFEEVFDRIDRCLDELSRYLAGDASNARTESLEDPSRSKIPR